MFTQRISAQSNMWYTIFTSRKYLCTDEVCANDVFIYVGDFHCTWLPGIRVLCMCPVFLRSVERIHLQVNILFWWSSCVCSERNKMFHSCSCLHEIFTIYTEIIMGHASKHKYVLLWILALHTFLGTSQLNSPEFTQCLVARLHAPGTYSLASKPNGKCWNIINKLTVRW